MLDNNQRESVLSLQLMCPRDRIQVIRLSTKLFHDLSHLARHMYFLLRNWIMPAPKYIWISINGLWLYLLKRKLQCDYPRFLIDGNILLDCLALFYLNLLYQEKLRSQILEGKPVSQKGRESTKLTPSSPDYVSENNTLSSRTSNKQTCKKKILK